MGLRGVGGPRNSHFGTGGGEVCMWSGYVGSG